MASLPIFRPQSILLGYNYILLHLCCDVLHLYFEWSPKSLTWSTKPYTKANLKLTTSVLWDELKLIHPTLYLSIISLLLILSKIKLIPNAEVISYASLCLEHSAAADLDHQSSLSSNVPSSQRALLPHLLTLHSLSQHGLFSLSFFFWWSLQRHWFSYTKYWLTFAEKFTSDACTDLRPLLNFDMESPFPEISTN